MKTYKPYQGGGGPTPEQTENNTLYLAELLDKENIPYELDHEWAKELWDGDEVQLKISVGDNHVYVGYDRWGYVIDGLDADQVSPEEALKVIKDAIFNTFQTIK